jgi:hypothetical protein
MANTMVAVEALSAPPLRGRKKPLRRPKGVRIVRFYSRKKRQKKTHLPPDLLR